MGEHDFATFGQPPRGDNTVRTVYVSGWTGSAQPFGWQYEYVIEANAFLYHMVRRLVGMQVEVGRGRLTVAEMQDALRRKDLSLAKVLAPPHGLVLECVRYRE
jgi:tRNA pseudouridine38-40 synthase